MREQIRRPRRASSNRVKLSGGFLYQIHVSETRRAATIKACSTQLVVEFGDICSKRANSVSCLCLPSLKIRISFNKPRRAQTLGSSDAAKLALRRSLISSPAHLPPPRRLRQGCQNIPQHPGAATGPGGTEKLRGPTAPVHTRGKRFPSSNAQTYLCFTP